MRNSFKHIKILGLTLMVFLFPSRSIIEGQSCLPEGIRFSSQHQIDSFALIYPGCQTILGSVTIKEDVAGNIQNLTGLTQVQAIQGTLIIQDNGSLKQLSGLGALHFLGNNLFITSNTSLIDLEGLNHLTVIEGSLNISDNDALKRLSGFGNLGAIQGHLTISSNPKLTDLKGLDRVSLIEQHFILSGNQELQSFEGLSDLEYVGSEFLVIDNPRLKNFSGLENLIRIGTHLVIENNTALQNLTGLDNIREVGGNIQIVNNDRIINLKGLNQVQSMDGLLQVYNNPALESLAGIDSIDAQSIEELVLFSSTNLSHCSVKSVCDYLKQSENLATVRENGHGCQNIAEVLEKCSRHGPTIVSDPERGKSYFFPNPSTGLVYPRDPVPDHARFRATDIIGRKIVEGDVLQNQIDLTLVAAGVYLLEVWYDDVLLKEFVIIIQ